jgi:hypothetical protein
MLRVCFIRLLCCVAVAGLSAAHAGTDPASPLGTNLNGVTDFSDEFPFVNRMKSARDWIPGRVGCFDCREPGGNPACNAPNVCPTTLATDADGYVMSLDAAAQQQITTALVADGAAGHFAAGEYTVLYDGEGTFEVLGGSVISQQPGRLVFNVPVPAPGTTASFFLRLSAVTPGNHVRNMRVLPSGGVCSNDDQRSCDALTPCGGTGTCRLFSTPGVAEDQIFDPRFLRNTAPYRLLRYMDWMETNSSPVVSAADYSQALDAFWHPVPIEILAELGNRLRSDIWINVPHRASDAFVDALATTLRDEFTTDRRIYVEYGNENWNGLFSQNIEIPRDACPAFADLAAGCQNDGVPGNGIACERDPNTFSLGAASGPCFQALVRRWGDRSVEIFDRFDTHFGAAARDRLVRVVAAQAANADLGRQVLARGTTASKTDAYAIAPYFGTGYCTPGGVNPDTHPAVYASTDTLLDDITANSLPEALSWVTQNRQMLSSNGFSPTRLISYEGGQHLAGVGGFTFNATCNARFDAANASPRMGTLYTAYLQGWHTNGGDEFTHFVNAGRWSVFGRWGALEFQDQAPSASPKYTALTNFVATNPCWWPNCTQSVGGVVDPVFANGFE